VILLIGPQAHSTPTLAFPASLSSAKSTSTLDPLSPTLKSDIQIILDKVAKLGKIKVVVAASEVTQSEPKGNLNTPEQLEGQFRRLMLGDVSFYAILAHQRLL